MKNCVIVDQDGRFACVDPCGFPVFDDKLCGRTTKFEEGEADQYVLALKKNHLVGLSVVKIT